MMASYLQSLSLTAPNTSSCVDDMHSMGSIKTICGIQFFSSLFTFSTQYVSLDAVSAIISSESFQSSSAGGQVRIIIPVLINILSQSNSSLSILQNKYVSYVLTDISLSEPPLSPRERRQSFFTREGTTAQSVVQSGSPRSSMQLDYTEQENSLIALKNLRQFCEMNNASLIRIGLDCIMDELATLDSCNA